jgi:hypothetical protein
LGGRAGAGGGGRGTAQQGKRRGGGGGGGGGGAAAVAGAWPPTPRTQPDQDASAAADREDDHDDDGGGGDDEAAVLPVGVLRAYVAWARGNAQAAARAHPDADLVAAAYYRGARQAERRAPSRTTARLLPSLVRLAQAHARLVGRAEVTRQDAVVAALVAEASMAGGEGPLARVVAAAAAAADGGGPGGGAHFPADPDGEYARLEPLVLRALGLERLLVVEPPGGGGGGGGA